MISIRLIDELHKEDINIKNEPFYLFGRMIPEYRAESWSFTTEQLPSEEIICFPDENYDYESMKKEHLFVGAYDEDRCIGLAILRHQWHKYLYLYDLKVNRAYRKHGVGALLMDKIKEIALEQGYRGVWTQGQDNNLTACLFYIKQGFVIGGLDTHVYTGTSQDGKSDILFYWDK